MRIFVLFLCLFVWTRAAVSAPLHDDETRVRLVEKWLELTLNTSRLVSNKKLQEVVQRFVANAIIARPTHAQDLVIIGEPSRPAQNVSRFAIVPLFAEDRSYKAVTRFVGATERAVYVPETRTLWVSKHEGISDQFMALMLIHEAIHVNNIGAAPLKHPQHVVWCSEEYIACETQAIVLQKLGGARYAKLLREDITRSVGAYKKNGSLTIGKPRYDERYTPIFGVPVSQADRLYRTDLIERSMVIETLKELSPGTKGIPTVVATFCRYYAHGAHRI